MYRGRGANAHFTPDPLLNQWAFYKGKSNVAQTSRILSMKKFSLMQSRVVSDHHTSILLFA